MELAKRTHYGCLSNSPAVKLSSIRRTTLLNTDMIVIERLQSPPSYLQ